MIRLLIVVDHSTERKYRRPLRAYDALLNIDISKNIIVYTCGEFNDRIQDQTTLCFKIKKEARRLYAKI